MRRFMTGALLAAVASLHPGAGRSAQSAESCLDVALVLTIDASASVSPEEFDLQRAGVATAFRNPDVLKAISSAGRVAVSAVIWASEGLPKQRTGWIVIDGPRDAERFARVIETTPREVTGDTGLGAGLAAAMQQFNSLGQCAVRKVINVSGDGADTPFVRLPRKWPAPSQVKAIAEKQNVEINALAIINKEIDLPAYYAQNVITGPDAFVMEIRSYSDVTTALQKKLIREIAPRQVSGRTPEDDHSRRPAIVSEPPRT